MSLLGRKNQHSICSSSLHHDKCQALNINNLNYNFNAVQNVYVCTYLKTTGVMKDNYLLKHTGEGGGGG